MINKKSTFALVGCGAVAKKHLGSIAAMDNAILCAVCDTDEQLAARTGKDHGVPHFTDALEMARSVDVDVISVLTPSGMHSENVFALAPIARNILVEKPMALTTNHIDLMIEACRAHSTGLFVVKQNRCNRPIVKLREAIDQDRFGRLVLGTIRVRWSRDQAYFDSAAWRGTILHDGGVLANQAAHHIDMLLWMFGRCRSVYAATARKLVDIEAEETVALVLKFESGAVGIVEATTATRPKDLEGSISVLGEFGNVEVGGFSMNELKAWNFSHPEEDDDLTQMEWGKNPNTPYWNLTAYLQQVIASIDGETSIVADANIGRQTIAIVEAARVSATTGQEVKID